MNSLSNSQTLLEELFEKLGIVATCELDSENNMLEVTTEDHALVIGKRGENLRALQYIFNTLRRRKYPESEFVAIDVAGYKKERIVKVKRIAEEAAAEVLAYGHPKTLPAMNAFERRQAHMVLADTPDLVTESVGVDPNRSIVIKKRP